MTDLAEQELSISNVIKNSRKLRGKKREKRGKENELGEKGKGKGKKKKIINFTYLDHMNVE